MGVGRSIDATVAAMSSVSGGSNNSPSSSLSLSFSLSFSQCAKLTLLPGACSERLLSPP